MLFKSLSYPWHWKICLATFLPQIANCPVFPPSFIFCLIFRMHRETLTSYFFIQRNQFAFTSILAQTIPF